MLIKLTPPTGPVSKDGQGQGSVPPTILFALNFPDLPPSLPIPPAWSMQLGRLAADDLEAPPSLHALDRAAGIPSLLSEVLFDLPARKVTCTFLDGKIEDWKLGDKCEQMLKRVIEDVEESGRVDDRARHWQKKVETERAQAATLARHREREEKLQRELAQLQEASRERESETDPESQDVPVDKGKEKEHVLNSPPTHKGQKSKGRLQRSRSLLMALVQTFSASNNSGLPPSSPLAQIPASAPASRSSFAGQRSTSPFRAFARRASFSTLSGATATARSDQSTAVEGLPSTAPLNHRNLETPPGSAPASSFPSSLAVQQMQTLSSIVPAPSEEMSARALRRRARSTLVDAFRAHVLPELAPRAGLYEQSSQQHHRRSSSESSTVSTMSSSVLAPGGGYHAWVARSMMRRAQVRMDELEDQWPELSPHSRGVSEDSVDHSAPSINALNTIAFPVSPRRATFEPWSSDESGSDQSDEDESQVDQDSLNECGLVEDSGESDTDGSSVHTPESVHANIGYSGVQHTTETSTSSTSSYFTCAADTADGDDPSSTISHLRRPAHSSPIHSRSASSAHPRDASGVSKRELRERKRAQRAATTEHEAFVRMTMRLRLVLSQATAGRRLLQMQKDDSEKIREQRGVRRALLDPRQGPLTFKQSAAARIEAAKAFRPSGLGRMVVAASEIEQLVLLDDEAPPSYEDVVASLPKSFPERRKRMMPPSSLQRTRSTLAHLDLLPADVHAGPDDIELDKSDIDDLDIEVDLQHLELSQTLDVEGMGLDVELDFTGDSNVFGPVKARSAKDKAGRKQGVPRGARLEGWERRRTLAIS